MNKIWIGGFLTLSGTIGVAVLLRFSSLNLITGWVTPLGRLICAVLENGLAIPLLCFSVIFIMGVIIIGIEYKKSGVNILGKIGENENHKKIFNNTRKPEGLLGKIMVKSMNRGHSAVSDWGMEHIRNFSPSAIIELGCGGGRNAAELLRRFPGATVHALDYSEVSVQKTK